MTMTIKEAADKAYEKIEAGRNAGGPVQPPTAPEFDRAAWLAARRAGIGASDAAAVCGMAAGWGATPLQVYLDKLGLLDPEPMKNAMRVGIALEPMLATLYEDLGLKEKWFRDPGPAEGLANVFTALALVEWLRKRVDMLLANPGLQKEPLSRGYAEHLALAKKNRNLLGEFVAGRGLCPDLSDRDGGAEWVA